MTPLLGDQAELRAQLERARAALKAKPQDKVFLVLQQMPALVERLERVQLYQTEIGDLRTQLVAEVAKLQRLIWGEMREHPGQTRSGGPIRRSAMEIDRVLAKISELVGP